MTFFGNYEKSTCCFCKRRISKTNCSKHGAVCWPKHIVVMLAIHGEGWAHEILHGRSYPVEEVD